MQVEAANDYLFYKERNRTLPIPTTITSIVGYPSKLRIFLTNASRYWQVRCFTRGKTTTKSLRTTSKRDAIAAAKIYYEKQVLKIGATLNAEVDCKVSSHHSIDMLAEMLLAQEQARVDRGEISQNKIPVVRSHLHRHIIPFFKKVVVEAITTSHIHKFHEHLVALSLNGVTSSQIMTDLRKILHIAVLKAWIDKLPDFPVVKKITRSRGGFSVKEYCQILKAAKQLRLAKLTPSKATHRNTKGGIYTAKHCIPHEFVWLIRFMINSFVRPVDVKVIQHQHVEIVRGEHCYLRLTLPETKLHTGQIITLPAAVHVYEKLKAYFDLQGLAKPSDYLFMPQIPNRADAMPLMEGYFRQIMEYTGLRVGAQGQKRTLYSLRHSSITFRLLYGRGIDLLTLARNARTSVEMIEKHYASELTAEMNVDMLHSRR